MIIGLVGFIGSGKGTVGDILVTQHGYYRFAFADALKDAVATIFTWPRGLLEGDTAALRMCLDRCIAPLRSTTQNIPLNFEGELHERGEATLQAIYAGDIDPLTGSALIGALADQARLKEQTELEARLSHLENKL